jgi:TonB family protein
MLNNKKPRSFIRRGFLLSGILHLLPIVLLFFVFADNRTTNDKEVDASIVSISGAIGVDIGDGTGKKEHKINAKQNSNYGIPDNSNTNLSTGNGLSGSGGGTGINAPTTYAGEIVKKIYEYKYYPPQAKALKLSGVSELGFSIKKDGNLNGEPKVLNTSGHEILDRTAIKIIKNSAPFPAFPQSIKEKELNLKVSIDFTL